MRAREAGIEALCLEPARLRRIATRTTARSSSALRARDVGPGLPGRLHAAGRRAAARRVSQPHPEHPPVAAAGVSRARRAAAGARARRARVRRDGASGRRRARRRADRPQAAVPVLDDDTVETLSARILVEEHRLYPEAIRLVLDGGWRVEGRRFVCSRPATTGLDVERQHRHFRRAVDPHRDVDRSDAAADEHRRVARAAPRPATTGNFLRGDGADDRQHDLSAVRVAREHERNLERGRFGRAAAGRARAGRRCPSRRVTTRGDVGWPLASRTGCRRDRASRP